MNELMEKELVIENMIYEIRGKQVMLDSDVSALFGYETKYLNRQVQRNINRFPENYCFQLTEEEHDSLRCQIGTLKQGKGQHRKYLPYVFTEYGITMLAGILKSDIAVEMSLKIVNAFIAMRKYLKTNNYERRISNIETKLIDYDNKFEMIFDKLDTKVNNHLFYEGQIYDAYSLLLDIFNTSKQNVIIIDNYIDKNILDVLSKTDKEVLIITNKYNNNDYLKYIKQYNNIKIKINNKIHDRFIIIDNKELYHCGSSFKDLGKKCFAITKIENKEWLDSLIKYIDM